MNNVGFAVGGQAAFLDNLVKLLAFAYIFKRELRVALVRCRQQHRPHAHDTIEKTSVKLYIHDAEHIEVVYLLAEYPPAIFNPVRADLITGRPDLQYPVEDKYANS